MSARARWRVAAALLLAGLSLQASASYRCLDPWGHDYVAEQDLSQAGMRCTWTEPGPEPLGEEPPRVSVTPAAMSTRGRGLLVLAPPVRAPAVRPASTTVSGSTPYDPLIAAVASAYGQDEALLRAIVQVESRFDPNAVSARGAIGLMQVMPATAAQFGLAEPQRALFEPESNLRTGAQVLRSLLVQFAGDTELAVAAYNAGPGAVMRSGYAVPAYVETRNYVRSVLAIYRASR